jgi:hypothetical protein
MLRTSHHCAKTWVRVPIYERDEPTRYARTLKLLRAATRLATPFIVHPSHRAAVQMIPEVIAWVDCRT